MHVPIAFSVGVEREIVARIGAGQDPPDLPPADAAVFDAVREIAATRGLSDRTYAAAVDAFGEAGVIDLLGVVGYYSTLAMIMNVARTPAPEADPPLR